MADESLKVFEERDQMRKRVERKLGWYFDQLEWHLEFEEIKQLLLERYPELSEELSSPSPTIATPLTSLDPIQSELGQNCEALLVFDKMTERNAEQEPEKKDMLQGGEEKSQHVIVGFQFPAKTTVNSPNTFEILAPPLLFESPSISLFVLTKPMPIYYTHNLFDLMPESAMFLFNKLNPNYFPHDPYYRSFLLDIPPPQPPLRPPLRPPLQPLDLTQVYSQPPRKFNQQNIESTIKFYANKLFVLMSNSSIIFSNELSQAFSPHNPYCHSFSIYLPPPRSPSQQPDSFPFHKNPPTSSPYWQELCVLFDRNFIQYQFYGSVVHGNWYKSVKKKEDMNENYVNFERVVEVKRAVKEFSTGFCLQGKPTVRFMIGNFREVVTATEELVGCPNASINTWKLIEHSASSFFSSSGLLKVTWLPSFAFKVLCSLLTHEGLFKEAYALVAEIVNKLVVISQTYCHPFITERASVVQDLIKIATDELHLFKQADKTLFSTTSPHEAEILLGLHALSLEASLIGKEKTNQNLPEKECDVFLPQEMDINASLLEKTFSLVLKVSSLVDFDSKRAHFSSIDDHHLPQKQKVGFGIEDHKRETRFMYSHSLFPVLEVKAIVTNHWVAREGHYSLGLVAYENTAEYLGQFNIEIYLEYCFTSYVCLFEEKFNDLPPTPLQLEEDLRLLGRAQVKCGLVIKLRSLSIFEVKGKLLGTLLVYHLETLLTNTCLRNWRHAQSAAAHHGSIITNLTFSLEGLINISAHWNLLTHVILFAKKLVVDFLFYVTLGCTPGCSLRFGVIELGLYRLTVSMHDLVSIMVLVGAISKGAALSYRTVQKFVISEDGQVNVSIAQIVKEWAELLIFCFEIFSEHSKKLLGMCIRLHHWKVWAEFLKDTWFINLLIYSLNINLGFITPLPSRVQWRIAWSMTKWKLNYHSLLSLKDNVSSSVVLVMRSLRTRIILSSGHCHVGLEEKMKMNKKQPL